MTGAYAGGLQISVGTDLGTVTATSTGPILTTGGSTYTKGSWTQIVASLAQDAAWLMFYIQTETSSGSNYAVDIGVGGSGSEIAIVSNLFFSAESGGGHRYMFPLSIPAGTRVSARAAGSNASTTISIGLTVFSDSYQSAGCGSAIDTYGFSSATILGTSVDPGSTANTKGAYSQITASTLADIAGIFVLFDCQNDITGSGADCTFLIDVAVGSSGSEVVIVPNIPLCSSQHTNASAQMAGFLPYLPIQIGAGSRISVRAQCSVNTSPDRLFGCTVWGVRL